MNFPKLSRRQFMVGCSTAIAAMAGSRLGYVAFDSLAQEPNQQMLLVIFLRGGYDGLSLVAPLGDEGSGQTRALYEEKRPTLKVPVAEALPLGTMPGAPETSLGGGVIPAAPNVVLGLHPSAAPLHNLYQDGKLAVFHAAGLEFDNRSHFDMMAFMELGTPGEKGTNSGWLTRYLESAPNLPGGIFPSVASGGSLPTALLGSTESVAVSDPDSFDLNVGYWRYQGTRRSLLRDLYAGSTWLDEAGLSTLNTLDAIEAKLTGDYQPANGASYPNSSFGRDLQVVAQMIRSQLGMSVATIDLGGWDTHENQGDPSNGGSYFSEKIEELSLGLNALYTDLDGAGSQNYNQRLTVVIMSEFGRRLRENDDRGTDHGHGGVILTLGGEVNGGLYGLWPGLLTAQLYDRADLRITTDYRRILSEIIIGRMRNPYLGQIFPGITADFYHPNQPLGFINFIGDPLTPVYDGPAPSATPTPSPSPTPSNIGTLGDFPNHVYLPFVKK